MTEHIYNGASCFVFLLAKAYQKGHSLVQKRLQPYGVTNNQYVVLEALWQQEGLTAVELGQMLTIDKATLTGILDRMAESDLLVKKHDRQDKRLIRLYPSERSKGFKETLIGERQKANEELLSGFTPEERVLLRRFLLSMTRSL
jgi:DNA-binding MarR family transcriptional regulator